MKSEFLHILQERGFVNQCTNLDKLDELCANGMAVGYNGYDPTGTSLHIGHLFTLMLLHWFQKCGHKPITLMGGGTALIPDPTLKDKTRPLLSLEDIKKNIGAMQTVFTRFLDYDTGDNRAVMVNNYDWLSEFGYIEFLREIGPHYTINRMLTFESVKQRLDRELPMTFIEFNYMILQGYDFLELHKRYGCNIQFGGSDQWGNIISGVELGHKKSQLELVGMTVPLLTTPDGKKMGKTEGGAVFVNPEGCSDYDYYQYFRNVQDGNVEQFLKIFTLLPMDEIRKLAALRDQEINEAKKILAFEATRLCRGEDAAYQAAETARVTFEAGAMGADLPIHAVSRGAIESNAVLLADVYVDMGFAESKGAFRRLAEGGGIRLNDQTISDPQYKMTPADFTDGKAKISAGKKRHGILSMS